MKSFFTLLFSFLCFAMVMAQDINPFESIGKEGRIITLSKGKYLEIENNDSLQRIGSVIVDMYTGEIYELLDSDTLYQESDLSPTIITRWWSVDPLASKYPGQSPYAFCNNNPLLYKDPNGESGIITITPGQNGNPGTITISMNVTLYGDGADPVLAELTANKLNKLVNDANLKYLINGEEYIVQLDLKMTVGTELVAYTGAQGNTLKSGKNTNPLENFARVEEINQSQKEKGDADGWVALAYAHRQGFVSEWSGGIGGNTGFLIKGELENDPTSVLHELFHGLFSTHEAIENMNPDLPAVSIPANSPARQFENMPGTYLTTNNKGVEVVDAKKRMLTTYDLNAVFQALGYEINAEGNGANVKLNNTGSTTIKAGNLDNNYYDKNGNVDNDRSSRRSND